MNPEPRSAWNGDSIVAYEVVGDGPVDLVYMPGFFNNLEVVWDNLLIARFLKRLASFLRLIMIHRRGMGLSDRLSPEDLPPIEELEDDIDAVLDAVGSERAVIFGYIRLRCDPCDVRGFHPDRTAGLILCASGLTFEDAGEHELRGVPDRWRPTGL